MRSLNSIFPGWISGNGIFSKLALLNVPWPTNISGKLDMEYHGNISVRKPISPLVASLLGDEDELTEAQKEELAGVIYALCGDIWEKEYATLSYEYDPIENYSMIEQMTNDTNVTTYGKRDTMTNDLTHTKTGTEQVAPLTSELTTDNLSSARTVNLTDGNTKNLTDQRTANLTDTANVSTYGFNSATAVPTDTTNETHTGTDTTANTGTRTVARSGTDTTTYNTTDKDTGTRGNVSSGSDQSVRNYTLTRSGNIGVTTSQQMIQSERDLDMWNFFYSVVFPSVDKVLTLMIFN